MNSESFQKEPYSSRPAIIVLTIGGLIILAVAIMFVDRRRLDTRRVRSIQQLQVIALATLNYEQAHLHLPSAGLPIDQGGPVYGWEVRVRPFMDSWCVEDWQVYLASPLDPDSQAFFKTPMKDFQSPHSQLLVDHEGYSLSHYAATVEAIPVGEPKQLESLDPNKEMFGEIAAGFQSWVKPGNTRTLGNGVWFDEDSFGNPEYNGVSYAHVDGSVHYELLDDDRRR